MTYSIGLDIGTGSVGWAVIGDDYRLKRAKGKNLIGVRLFDSATTAAERRGYRTTRRRLSRRHWRLRLLNDIFASDLAEQDENFLPRLKYSWVNPDDEQNPQLNSDVANGALLGSRDADKAFHKNYPTIYHLRHELMTDTAKHDLREVYLAIHHIVKYRGNFLNTADKINAENSFDVDLFVAALDEYNEFLETPITSIKDAQLFSDKLTDINARNKSVRVENAMSETYDSKSKIFKAILTALVGNTANFQTIFDLSDLEKDEVKNFKFKLDLEDVETKLDVVRAKLSDEQNAFLEAVLIAYDGITLKMILGDYKSISQSMIESYKSHQRDWEYIKKNVRLNEQKIEPDKNSVKIFKLDPKKLIYPSNLAYLQVISSNEDEHRKGLDYFKTAIQDVDILQRIENDTFLPRQRTKRNGVLPYQLHLAELEQIIKKQSKYYPFLANTYTQDNKTENKLIGLLKFRVPYYVGPLVEAEKVTGDGKNHWLIKKELQENTPITPFNFDDVVDKDKSGEQFIKRITGTDSYLIGEPTLPENSLLYQKYNVLQELNNVRNERHQRLPIKVKQDIFEHVFKIDKNVNAKKVMAYLKLNGYGDFQIAGLSDTRTGKFNSNLSSYNYFVDLLGREKTEKIREDRLEEIIEIQTVFEDKIIVAKRLSNLAFLTPQEKSKLSGKHYTGWGRLSRKLLTTRFIKTNLSEAGDIIPQSHSIIDLLYYTDKNLMEILNDKTFNVRNWLTEQNKGTESGNSLYDQIDALAGPKNIKRGITQVFSIIDDIKKAMGSNPETVYLEFAREPQDPGLTNSRLKRVQEIYNSAELKAEFADLGKKLEAETKESIHDDRLYLYYLQEGRDMYTGKEIPFDQISSNYDIDHIIPQAFTKDDSLDNRVLVNRATNARKSNSPTFTNDIIDNRKFWWQSLVKRGLMSKEKFERLTDKRKTFSENQTNHFIARQLVETRQIIKNVADLIKNNYDGTQAVAIRASLTGEMRRYLDWPKNRDMNDYHHAHDALMMATVGKYVDRRGFFDNGSVSDGAGNAYNLYTKDWLVAARVGTRNDSQRVNPYGFIVGSMNSKAVRQQVNKETGEIVWGNENLDYLRHVLSYKKILVTRRLHGSSGRLYAETLFSPNPKAKLIAQKANRSVALYGGFTKAESAYMALVEFNKKGDRSYKLIKVPMTIANRVNDKQITVTAYIASLNLRDFSRVVLEHLPIGTLIRESDGSEFYAASSEYKHNAKELWAPKEILRSSKKLDKATAENLIDIFDFLISDKTINHFKFYEKDLLHLKDVRDKFVEASDDIKLKMLADVIYELNNDKGWRDPFKHIQEKPAWTRLEVKGGIKLSEKAIIVYQSPTGLFETINIVGE
ncbi:type II CRISPR RNA-guided endonuclease Cas9 [Leuconostoc gelidum subsp. aenigmaticum]|uniref:type II CRISPR RNA-guided endonuclease Cas9 n=1 Tax=Leuconostoc gelidum TaxID=1244 RepID=UPI001CC3FCA9|nr:type II CRISPR RNA-guided endonuclease Cas9 [Leuconostoc gelidum]MBZ6007975.1 type II CRISPR RNA-guided endonuclease Cas9 [Leuconostoc gelidum subsp. aenigmaticum]